MSELPEVIIGVTEQEIEGELVEAIGTPRQQALEKFGLAAIGAIPWIGGFVAAYIEWSKGEKVDHLQAQWLRQHQQKMDRLNDAIGNIAERLTNFGDEINQRLESPEYLALVDKGFRAWDSASTGEKRDYIRRLLANAAAISLCSDDLVRLFLAWIETYDETHFKVIRAIYNRNGITRRGIWLSMHPTVPRDDSSEADLFKLLIHDLTLGYVVRQQRATTTDGQFLKKRAGGGGRRVSPSTMKSPFDDYEPYELTELGQQFVHYVMDELAPQIGRTSYGK
jgi:hypothetical protein